jgi:hypothetical protein
MEELDYQQYQAEYEQYKAFECQIYEQLMAKINKKSGYNKVYLTDNEAELITQYGKSILPNYLMIKKEGTRTFVY